MDRGWQRHSKAIRRQQKNQSEMHDKLHYLGSNVRGLLMFADITGTYSELHWNCQLVCLTAWKLFDCWIIKTGLSTISRPTESPLSPPGARSKTAKGPFYLTREPRTPFVIVTCAHLTTQFCHYNPTFSQFAPYVVTSRKLLLGAP